MSRIIDSTGAQVTEHRLGALRVATHRGAAPYVLGSMEPGHGAEGALVGVGTQPEGEALLSQPGSRVPCAPGEVFVVDLSRPWELRQSGVFRLHLCLVPRDATGLPDEDLALLWGVHGRVGETGVARLLVSLLAAVAEGDPAYPRHIAHGVAGSVVNLLATLATERKAAARAVTLHRDERDERGERAVMARRVRHFVNENLADRRLTPGYIAARHRVSVRYLHKVFAGEGTTLSRWIRRRRLEECRRELARPDVAEPASSPAAVARRWGFAGTAHFRRSFRAAYGVSPSEWHRVRAGAGTASAD